MSFKYLHAVGQSSYWLDHRLCPEVRGMFAAFASRAPVGGIQARYGQVVEAVADDLWLNLNPNHPWATMVKLDAELGQPGDILFRDEDDPFLHTTRASLRQSIKDFRNKAEDRLCTYPLHPKVQRFFDDFVGKYGHSSILELTGSPAVISETVSWFTAWQLFDSPLCAGQEFSTRAVQHKDWPMARECMSPYNELKGQREAYWKDKMATADTASSAVDADFLRRLEGMIGVVQHPDLVALHADWFEVFEAEVAWWKEHLSDEANRLALGIGDKEPFRPALDRARWALPGTIATGCAHTSNLRERSRVLRDGASLAAFSKAPAAMAVWKEIADTYREALPGLAGMGLKEAVYTSDTVIPGHVQEMFSGTLDGPDAEVWVVSTDGLSVEPFQRKGAKSYLDVAVNTGHRVNVVFRCSLAVARDWHRHRTLFPWLLQVVRGPTHMQGGCVVRSPIQIDHHYTPMSDLGKTKVPELLARSTRVFDDFMVTGNVVQAALALPLGTRVRLRGQGGLRDVVYMLELRHTAHGANFEYREQAGQALSALVESLGPDASSEYRIKAP